MLDHTPGLPFDKPAAVENALALYRRYESLERQTDGFNDPSELHVYETSKPREIDFGCGPRRAADLVEVKFQSSVSLVDARSMRKAFPGRPGVVASMEARGAAPLGARLASPGR